MCAIFRTLSTDFPQFGLGDWMLRIQYDNPVSLAIETDRKRVPLLKFAAGTDGSVQGEAVNGCDRFRVVFPIHQRIRDERKRLPAFRTGKCNFLFFLWIVAPVVVIICITLIGFPCNFEEMLQIDSVFFKKLLYWFLISIASNPINRNAGRNMDWWNSCLRASAKYQNSFSAMASNTDWFFEFNSLVIRFRILTWETESGIKPFSRRRFSVFRRTSPIKWLMETFSRFWFF